MSRKRKCLININRTHNRKCLLQVVANKIDFTNQYLPKMVSSSDVTEKSQMPPMNDILMKYSHLGDKIFKLMKSQDIQNLRNLGL